MPLAGPSSIVALISSRGGGDWPSVVAVAVGLRDRGHKVLLVCDEATYAAVRPTMLEIMRVPPRVEQPDIRLAMARNPQISAETSNPLIEWARACGPCIREQIQQHKPAVLLSSLFCAGLADRLASDLRVPWCFINPSFYFGEDSARPWDADFLGVSIGTFRFWFQPVMRHADLILHATDQAFDVPPPRLLANHHYVGPLLWEPLMDSPAFLRLAGPPWVLVSVSTLPQAGEVAIAQAAIEALRHEDVRLLVTVAPDHAAALGELPDRVHLSGYVPHSDVLKESRLVVSHAGHGIVMKALHHGVPMVLVPWGRDQPGVAARAEAMGVAAVITRDDCGEASVGQAVRLVMQNASFAEKAHTISKRLQASDAVGSACSKLETFLSTG